jgi:DNA-binding GntR family transcriptional regulator
MGTNTMLDRSSTNRSKGSGTAHGPRAAKVDRASTGRVVADHIRELIFDGELDQNSRVPQDAIAESLGVSRLPVREALIALEADGLVETKPHRGTFVVPITQEDIEDHYSAYGAVQGIAAARAISYMTDSIIEQLQSLNTRLAAAKGSTQHVLNWEFHSLINRTGGSRRLISLLRYMAQNLPRSVFELPPPASREAIAGHDAIIAALTAKDPAAVEVACREHMRLEGEFVVSVLKQRGILSSTDGESA